MPLRNCTLQKHTRILCSRDLTKGHNSSAVHGGIPNPWFLAKSSPRQPQQSKLRNRRSGIKAGECGFAHITWGLWPPTEHLWASLVASTHHLCSEGTWTTWGEICVGIASTISQNIVIDFNKADFTLNPSLIRLFLIARWIMKKYKSQRIYLMMARREKDE